MNADSNIFTFGTSKSCFNLTLIIYLNFDFKKKLYHLASFFNEFIINMFDVDFNTTEIENNKQLSIRKRDGISIDECARLCLTESTFRCESLTYNPNSECKWSSYIGYANTNIETDKNMIHKEGFDWFTR